MEKDQAEGYSETSGFGPDWGAGGVGDAEQVEVVKIWFIQKFNRQNSWLDWICPVQKVRGSRIVA